MGEKESRYIYNFYWDNGREGFLLETDAPREVVEKLLDEYRKIDEFYDNEGFRDLLEERGYVAVIITSYSSNSPVDIDADEHIPF